MSTRQDYERIESSIRAVYDESAGDPVVVRDRLRQLAVRVCREFTAVNPRMRYRTFLVAALGDRDGERAIADFEADT